MRGHRGRARQAPDAPAAIGQRIELDLERLAHDGRGIGRWQGRIVFVDGGLPGERVQARVLKARSKLIETRLDKLLVASPERQTPRCAHIDLCGGCSLQHMPEATQLQVKQQALAQQLQHFAGLEPERWMPALVGPTYGYRQRTRLAMRWDKRLGLLEVGYRQRSSSDLVEVQECPVLVPALEALVQDLVPLLKSLDGRAGLGHVELIGDAAPVLLVRHMQALSEADLQALKVLADQHGGSCWLQPGEPSTLHGPIGSDPGLNQELPAYHLPDQGLRFEFMPGDFIQVNARINQMMVNQALKWLAIQPGEQVLDLFCGVGNFALPLAHAGAQVTAVEGSVEMVQRAQKNAQNNQLESLHFSSADLSKLQDANWLTQPCDAALLDPPRDGAEQLVQQLADKAVGRILYVSCNPATLARDAGLLAARGYRLVQAGIMDMFPQTAHVEAMALFVAGNKVKPV